MNTLSSPLRRSLSFVLVALLLVLQGCLTIEEKYTFKKDGSGSMEYVVDMSEMAETLKGLPGAKGGKDDGPGKMELLDHVDTLKKLVGITKVKLKKEKDGFVQRLSFRFADIASLNNALSQLMPDSTGQSTEFFRWDGNTLVRSNNHHAKEMTSGMGGGSGDSTDISGILKMMRYKFDLRFADDLGDVQVADGVVKEADGTKRMKLSTDFSVIGNDPKALDMRVTLKK